MVLVNVATRQVTFKIVYCGPASSGKATNLAAVYDRLDRAPRSKMLTLETKMD